MKVYASVVSLLLAFFSAFSQETDTLSMARSSAYAQDFETADQLMSRYNAHRNDLDGLWLHAQILYWKKAFKRSAKTYERALAAFPDAHSLRLDYGRTLWDQGKLQTAQTQLLAFLSYDSLHYEANLLQAYVEYWSGALPKARRRGEILLQLAPDYAPAKSLMAEIQAVSAPWMSLQSGFLSDDQPLTAFQTTLEGGQYISRWLTPGVQFQYTRFAFEEAIHPYLIVRLSDQINFVRTKSQLSLSAGIVAPLAGNAASKSIGGLVFSQTLPAHFSLDLGIERRPYLYTLQSIRTPFAEDYYQAALRFDRSGKWMGKAALERQVFPDDNYVQTAYAWALIPLLDIGALLIQGGYAYSYGDTKENRFTPTGIFDPYFTPAKQAIHSLLASLRYSPSGRLTLSASGNVGVWAQADIPYFYPDMNPEGEIVDVKAFSREPYFPFEIHSEIKWNLGPRSSLSGEYAYQRFLFYNLHYGGIHLKYQFLP